VISGQILGDIGLRQDPRHCPDGSIELLIEALTIAE
jgi:hypothetical protein